MTEVKKKEKKPPMPLYAFRSNIVDPNLTPNAQIKIIIESMQNILTKFSIEEILLLLEKGNTLFGLMDLTDDAEQFLEWNKDLAEVIGKW